MGEFTDLTKQERKTCKDRLTALTVTLNDPAQFEGLLALGVREIVVWDEKDVQADEFEATAWRCVFDKVNLLNDEHRRVLREGLELLRDTLNRKSIFKKLVGRCGIRTVTFIWPYDVTQEGNDIRLLVSNHVTKDILPNSDYIVQRRGRAIDLICTS